MRILVIEDEAKVAGALAQGLEREAYDVAIATTGEEGFYRASSEEFDLILLDLMLPSRDGLEILMTLRKNGSQVPVLVLTARDGVQDRVLGLDRGADDYLVKPFAFPELLARVRALLRRGRPEPLRLRCADLEVDLADRTVSRAGEPLDLRAREFELLAYLMKNQGQLVSREMLARDVWKIVQRGTPLDNVIDVHIARVRKKVDSDASVKLIHTVRGVGFVLSETEP
jgi:DNA-binding response OmpR family regulator